MRLIAHRTLEAFWRLHPHARVSLERWEVTVRTNVWMSMSEVQTAFPKAKVLDAERVRFEINHNEFRLVASFDFRRRIAFVKFLGTHKEYDAIDPFTVSRF